MASSLVCLRDSSIVQMSLSLILVPSLGLFSFCSSIFPIPMLQFLFYFIIVYNYSLEVYLFSNEREMNGSKQDGRWEIIEKSRRRGNFNHGILCEKNYIFSIKRKKNQYTLSMDRAPVLEIGKILSSPKCIFRVLLNQEQGILGNNTTNDTHNSLTLLIASLKRLDLFR